MTGSWRTDWLIPNTHIPQHEFHDTPEAADTALWRLRFRGVRFAVSWFDGAEYS